MGERESSQARPNGTPKKHGREKHRIEAAVRRGIESQCPCMVRDLRRLDTYVHQQHAHSKRP